MSMEINILLLPEIDSVYMINGNFSEVDKFSIASDAIVYVTVLPLDAMYMPYTVKLLGAKPKSNDDLAISCKISEREYAIKLGKRFASVYNKGHSVLPEDICKRFFYSVKGGHFGIATSMMTNELGANLNEANLTAFFLDFTELILVKNSYYLVDKTGVGHQCRFYIKDGKIDNITID